jgi:tRNA G18 (ribose-2'-O)-methylase SpoU
MTGTPEIAEGGRANEGTSRAHVEIVDDASDPRLAVFRLSERGLTPRSLRRSTEGRGRFVAEGDLVSSRALAAGCRPIGALCRSDDPPSVVERLPATVPVFGASERLRRQVTGLGVPLDVIVVFERPTTTPLAQVRTARRLVVLEAVDNPANVGGVVRSAAALGWSGLVVDRTSADPLARRALRTSMGTTFDLPWARSDDLVDFLGSLSADGVTTVALTPRGDAIDLDHLDLANGPLAIVLGAERTGLSDEVLAVCTARGRIPMAPGFDSLNIAAAAAVACWAFRPTGPTVP